MLFGYLIFFLRQNILSSASTLPTHSYLEDFFIGTSCSLLHEQFTICGLVCENNKWKHKSDTNILIYDFGNWVLLWK